MPFRQLPQSDAARLAALNALANKAASVLVAERPYPAALQTQLDTVLPQFKTEVGEVGDALSTQGAATSQAETDFLALQMIVSHFIQVLNLAIARGALPRAARGYYQLDLSGSALPPLTTHSDVRIWADRIIAGEAARVAAGAGPAMAMPSAAEVQTALTAYGASATTQSTAKDAYDDEQEDVAAMRPTVDELIKDLWDHIEFTYRQHDGPSKRRKGREWGIVYIPRPGEAADPEGEGSSEAPPAN